MKRICVKTVLHLKDRKEWEKEIDWGLRDPPTSYRLFISINNFHSRIVGKVNLPEDLSDHIVEFKWIREKAVIINEGFFEQHIYYEEI